MSTLLKHRDEVPFTPAACCLPTGVAGSRSRPTPPGFGQIVLCRPDAWVRVSFAHTRVSIVGWIYDPDHSLRPGMYVDVPHLDCLLVAAPITVEGLDHLIPKPKQLDGITAVYVDVVLGHLVTPSCSATTGAGPEYRCVGSKRPRCSARMLIRAIA